MIKWILFDQANVLTHHVFTREDTYSINNKTFPAKDLEKIYYTQEFSDFENGKINGQALIKSFLDQTKLDLSVSEYMQLHKAGIEPIEGMKEIVKALKQKYRLATLINEGAQWAERKFEVLGYKHLFEYNIISSDLGVTKPNELYYQKALDIINANPSQCLLIDDLDINCQGAEKVGIKTIEFQNPNQLINELAKFSIII